jgi:hypothetical protein
MALWNPFETEFGEFQKQLQIQNEEVSQEINLASNQAAAQEQKLQVMEREAASKYRNIQDVFRRRANLESDEARTWRLQVNEQKSSVFKSSNRCPDAVLTRHKERGRNVY